MGAKLQTLLKFQPELINKASTSCSSLPCLEKQDLIFKHSILS